MLVFAIQEAGKKIGNINKKHKFCSKSKASVLLVLHKIYILYILRWVKSCHSERKYFIVMFSVFSKIQCSPKCLKEPEVKKAILSPPQNMFVCLFVFLGLYSSFFFLYLSHSQLVCSLWNWSPVAFRIACILEPGDSRAWHAESPRCLLVGLVWYLPAHLWPVSVLGAFEDDGKRGESGYVPAAHRMQGFQSSQVAVAGCHPG